MNSILISPGALHGNCTVALSLWVSIARTSSSEGTHRQGGCNGKCLAYSAFSTGNCFMSLTYTQAKRTSFICSDEAAKRTRASETHTYKRAQMQCRERTLQLIDDGPYLFGEIPVISHRRR